ncbi:response regulator transcription factor [Salinithrix halophila]|uniref:Response regulator transcription factor n=1 Tax=Salinithrix halophila TaxID=1485204 RepID=A0ABV8JJ42_9BACL
MENNRTNQILSETDTKIIELISQEKANKEIADLLGMPQRTVEYHITTIMRKMGTSTRLGAVMRAIQKGIIQVQTPYPTENSERRGNCSVNSEECVRF